MWLTVKHNDSVVRKEFHKEILLWDALAEMGFILPRPCGGKGVCGNCEVMMNGEAVRACITYLEGDSLVEELSLAEDVQVVSIGECVVTGENALIEEGYGLAVDIGTTTLAGYLYKFPEGELVKTMGALNPQTRYGADVVTRMEYALKGGAEELKNCLAEEIRKLMAGISIDKYVITGNTAMLHFLTGKETGKMACAPYEPECLFGEWYENVYLPGCVSAFVGADIVCAVLSSGMMGHGTSLLVDIGTNGEMVLYKDGQLFCCSAPAGPAFEGAEISRGMLAENGAINKVYVKQGKIKYTTIGDGASKGICGSGLIDAIAVMLEMGVLDETGYLEESFEIGDSGVFISPEDIRQVQLAKAAIRAGLETLLKESNCTYENIETFYIAGGFGSYIDPRSAARMGLFPDELLGKVKVIGNAAGTGAGMILKSRSCLEKTLEISRKATTLQLADSVYFAEKYVEQMMFIEE